MAKNKKLLILGGSETQLPLIKKARKISKIFIVDNNKSCVSSKIFKKNFFHISTLDFKSLEKLALNLKIDGVCTYASDPSSLGVGYLNSKFNLNGFDLKSTKILQNKNLFRNFQKKIKLNFPFFAVYKSFSKFYLDIKKKKFKKKIVIKPTDRAGSLGVNIISTCLKKNFLLKYFNEAKNISFEKKVIVENCIERKNYQIAGDGFVVSKNNIKFFFAREHFSKIGKTNVPIGESFPLVGFEKKIVKKVEDEIKKLMSNLGKVGGPFNIDVIIDKKNRVFIVEIGPRSGGNLIPEVINMKFGFDMIANSINYSLSNKINNKLSKDKNFFCSFVLHSNENGYFQKIRISKRLKENVIFCRIFIKKGQYISKYMSSKNTIGLAIMKFVTKKELNFFFENHANLISCEVKKK